MTNHDELARAVEELLDDFYDETKQFSFSVEWRDRLRAALAAQPQPDEETVARFLAERFKAITSRRGDEPVDVCRFHREIAEDLIGWWPEAVAGSATPTGDDDDQL